MRMETDRLILREPLLQDKDAFFDMFSDAQTCRDDGGYPPFEEKDEAFHQTFVRITKEGGSRLFMEEKASGTMMGLMHLMPSDEPDAREIGYVIHRDFRRRGYATEAMQAVLAWLGEQGMTKAICTAYCFNQASRRMLEKLGFACTGLIEKENPEWNEAVYEKLL